MVTPSVAAPAADEIPECHRTVAGDSDATAAHSSDEAAPPAKECCCGDGCKSSVMPEKQAGVGKADGPVTFVPVAIGNRATELAAWLAPVHSHEGRHGPPPYLAYSTFRL